MKNNMLRRLALSAVTLGVCALSVTSATYAWFTTQTETKATSISGTTQASAGNMFIKTKTEIAGSTYSDWTTTATLNEEVANTVLKPVAAASTCTATLENNFTKNASNNDTSFSASIDTTDVLHYSVVFALSNLSTTTASSVKVNISDINKDNDQTGTQTLLAAAGTGATKDSKISVNVKEALAMGVCSTLITNENLSNYGITDPNYSTTLGSGSITASNKYYKYQEETSTVNVVSGSSTEAKAGTALNYYNNVFATSVTAPTSVYDTTTYFGTENQQIELFQVSGCTSAYVVCDFYFFIDGWDNQCFSAIGGLGITSGAMRFELNPVDTTN